MLTETYEKLENTVCRYCEEKIKVEELVIFDPYFNEIVHLHCLDEIREGHFSVSSVEQVPGTTTKEKINEDYVVWHITNRMK